MGQRVNDKFVPGAGPVKVKGFHQAPWTGGGLNRGFQAKDGIFARSLPAAVCSGVLR